jgi:hypothetical protein
MVLDARITTLLALSVLAWVRRFRTPPPKIEFLSSIVHTDRHIFLFPQVCAHCIYRLKLHPLSKYPGPRLAAITSWYPTFFVSRGDLHEQTHKWHTRYGMCSPGFFFCFWSGVCIAGIFGMPMHPPADRARLCIRSGRKDCAKLAFFQQLARSRRYL